MLRAAPLIAIAILTMVASCAAPQTPGNSAIWLMSAMARGDVDRVNDLLCASVVDSVDIDLSAPETLGPIKELFLTQTGSEREDRAFYGGGGEYSPAESTSIDADRAWTEIDFQGEDVFDREVWRIEMVRERGVWKACAAHLIEQPTLPPVDVDTVDDATIQLVMRLAAGEREPEGAKAALHMQFGESRWEHGCQFDPASDEGWTIVATGFWPEIQPNGAYLIAAIEASDDLSAWRAYTLADCAMRRTYP